MATCSALYGNDKIQIAQNDGNFHWYYRTHIKYVHGEHVWTKWQLWTHSMVEYSAQGFLRTPYGDLKRASEEERKLCRFRDKTS
mgnify:FL=1